MKVLVCGGRSFGDDALIDQTLDELWAQATRSFTLIHGDASGADAIANAWALAKRARGFDVKVSRFPAEWRRYGSPMAGPVRNQRMLTYGKPDLVLAFPGGSGTADMVARARSCGIRIVEIPARSRPDPLPASR